MAEISTETMELTQQDFDQALEDGACDVVDAMLSQGFIPDRSSIRIACKRGNLDLLHRLLNYPMKLQAGMVEALWYNQFHLLDHLYVAGADLRFENLDGCNLFHCVKDSAIESIRWLLDMGVHQMANRYGVTPLHHACFCGNLEALKLLLAHGGEQFIHFPDVSGNTPLNLACESSYHEIIKLLLQYNASLETISLANRQGETPLHAACNDITTAKIILDYCQNFGKLDILPATDEDGKTPVYRACSYGNTEVLALLLSYPQGAQTAGQANKYGTTPLHCACSVGNIEMIRLLLAHPEGVKSLTQVDKNGKTPRDKAPHLSALFLLY